MAAARKSALRSGKSDCSNGGKSGERDNADGRNAISLPRGAVMAIEVSPNASTTRSTEISVEDPDPSAIEVGGTEQQKIDHAAKQGAERAAKRINADKTKVPGNSIFTK
jgi:hypothetical protein